MFVIQVNEDDSDEDDLEAAYISDEETLDASDAFLNSLRHGVLAPEISVLYAICLIHEGGRNFIAKKCMASIDHLEQEPLSWLTRDGITESELTGDPQWMLFRSMATDTLKRTEAYAFVASVLHKTGKETDAVWSSHFAPIYGRIIDELRKNGFIDELTNYATDELSKFRRDQILRVILAWGRLQVHDTESKLAKAVESDNVHEMTFLTKNLLEGLRSLKQYLDMSSTQLLYVSPEGFISGTCVEVLGIYSHGYSLLAKEYRKFLDQPTCEDFKNECGDLISWLCGVSDEQREESDSLSGIGDDIPLLSSWQTLKQRAISLRCYNLCVAVNVATFSGWEMDEFTLASVTKRKRDGDFFGLQMEGKEIAGFLPSDVLDEIAKQWDQLTPLVPAVSGFDFQNELRETKEKTWYKNGIQKFEAASLAKDGARNGELEGMNIFLAYSRSCLDLAEKTGKERSNRLLLTCLSVLLPITQFCLEERIWRSSIGNLSVRESTNQGWRQETRKKAEKATSRIPRKRKQKEPAKSLDEWFKFEDGVDPLSNAVRLPASKLQSLWGAFQQATPERSKEIMKNVHDAMVKLRTCYTDVGVEKSSLQVAVELLMLVGERCCENPFLVLEQASVFASHGTKRGNSDAFFRETLPEESQCSAEEALVILGRADCFQAVFFPYEAAFLCSFVARCCSRQRESKSGWNMKWTVVSILCYNLSVMIRVTVRNITRDQTKREEFDPWDEDTVNELEKGREDAVKWKQQLRNNNRDTVKD